MALSLKGSNPFLCATAPSFRYDDFIVYLKAKRLEESTLEAKVKLVKHLASKYNLWDSDSVREYIYKAEWGGRRKNNAEPRNDFWVSSDH